MLTASDRALALRWAQFFRFRGYNVLPSRMDAKRPMVCFADLWEVLAPAKWFTDQGFPGTSNLQIVTGRHWRLLVIDLDGPEARERFGQMGPALPRTWITHSGGNGWHVWLRLPAGFSRPLPRTVLWKGAGEHSAIERLCDRSLVMAPPSIHPTTGRRYRFLDHQHSPVRLALPADCPQWVLDLPPIEPERVEPVYRSRPIKLSQAIPAGRYRASEVLDAIPDKVGLAASWGLRIARKRAGADALACHAIGREDRHPSAIFNTRTGRYWDPWIPDGKSISLFELGAQLGAYRDWKEAVTDLGSIYHVATVERAG